MIDFQNGSVMKLMPVANDSYDHTISPLLIPGERVVAAYRTMRDGVVFTDKRIISLNYQGVTGKKGRLYLAPLQENPDLFHRNGRRYRP